MKYNCYSVSVFCLDVSALFYKPPDQFQIPALDGVMQDRIAIIVFYVDVQPFFYQPFDQFQISALGG